jgi:hypothetical protein
MREIKAPLYAVPDFAQHVEGKAGLVRLTKELWRMQAAKPKRP